MSAEQAREALAEVWAELRGSEAIGFVAEIQPEVAKLMLDEHDSLDAVVDAAREYVGPEPVALLERRKAGATLIGLSADPAWVRLVEAIAALAAPPAPDRQASDG